jgi:hypothetical protein
MDIPGYIDPAIQESAESQRKHSIWQSDLDPREMVPNDISISSAEEVDGCEVDEGRSFHAQGHEQFSAKSLHTDFLRRDLDDMKSEGVASNKKGEEPDISDEKRSAASGIGPLNIDYSPGDLKPTIHGDQCVDDSNRFSGNLVQGQSPTVGHYLPWLQDEFGLDVSLYIANYS